MVESIKNIAGSNPAPSPKLTEKSEVTGWHLANGKPNHRVRGGREVALEPDIGGRWNSRVEAI